MAKWEINKPGETMHWRIDLGTGVVHLGTCDGSQVMSSGIGDKFKAYKVSDYNKFISETDGQTGGQTKRKEQGYYKDKAEYETYKTEKEADQKDAVLVTYDGSKLTLTANKVK